MTQLPAPCMLASNRLRLQQNPLTNVVFDLDEYRHSNRLEPFNSIEDDVHTDVSRPRRNHGPTRENPMREPQRRPAGSSV